MTHRERHPTFVDNCFACKVASVTISAAALPNRRREAAATSVEERALDRDLDAYKRLRRNGVQPPSIRGTVRLEQEASCELEVERGKKLGATARSLSQDLRDAQGVT